jgi:hypothetical protein
MTSYLNDNTIWKLYFMIKYIWNFILMICIVSRCFDHTIWIIFRLTKWLKLHVMESMPNCWEHTDDFNIGKGIVLKLLILYMSLYNIHTSSGYHYFIFFIRNPKWIFVFMRFWINLMCSKYFGNEGIIIIESLWFWSKHQDYKLWFGVRICRSHSNKLTPETLQYFDVCYKS